MKKNSLLDCYGLSFSQSSSTRWFVAQSGFFIPSTEEAHIPSTEGWIV
jgi:hypothetical protein